MVLLSLYTAGRNDDIYPSANSFKPERWMRSDVGKDFEGVVDRRAYLPFAMGARACIGKILALTQLHNTLKEVFVCVRLFCIVSSTFFSLSLFKLDKIMLI